MSSGLLFLGASSLICVGGFLAGLRFARMPEERVLAGGVQMELPAFLVRGRSRVEQVHLFGRTLMIAAPLLLLFFAALSFGLLGPVDGIETIKLT
ncbi:MAG TPA: hypothetical protein VGC35_04010 [Allosphingosinicella sp.]